MSSSQSTKTSGGRGKQGSPGGIRGQGLGYLAAYVAIMIAEVLLAAILLLIDVTVSRPEAKDMLAMAIVSSASAIIAITYINMRGLAADVRSLSGVCERAKYFYLRDVIVCELPCGALMCVARQVKKAYISLVTAAMPARDSGDFYCVRYGEGALGGSGPTVFKGRLKALTFDGVVEGDGYAFSWSYSSTDELKGACKYVDELLGSAQALRPGDPARAG